jgi:hypothetical protein
MPQFASSKAPPGLNDAPTQRSTSTTTYEQPSLAQNSITSTANLREEIFSRAVVQRSSVSGPSAAPTNVTPLNDNTFNKKMAERFPATTTEQLNLGAYKNFNKLLVGDTLIINVPGQSFFQLSGSQWTKVSDPNLLRNLASEVTRLNSDQFNTKLKTIFPDTTPQALEAFSQFDKFHVESSLVIKATNSNTFYQLSGSTWKKVEDEALIAKLQPENPPKPTLEQTAKIATVSLSKSSTVVSDSAAVAFAKESLVAPLTNYLTAAVTGLVKQQFQINIQRQEIEDPKGALETSIQGLRIRSLAAQSPAEEKSIASEIEALEYCLKTLETPFAQNFGSQNERYLTQYQVDLKKAQRIYSPSNIEQLENALASGEIKGKAVDQEQVKFHLHNARVLGSILAGSYDTSQGQPSEYGEAWLYSIISSDDKLKQLGLSPSNTLQE